MKVKRLAVIYLYKNIFTEANRYQVLTLNYYVHYEKFMYDSCKVLSGGDGSLLHGKQR